MRFLGVLFLIALSSAEELRNGLDEQVEYGTQKRTKTLVKPSNGCGYSYNEPNNWRVIKGKDAPPHMFPWLAPLLRDGKHICSANIVSRRWLLTAAHCVHNRDPHLFQVQPGDHIIGVLHDTHGKQEQYNVKNIYVHPQYIGAENSHQHDLALLLINEDIKYSNAVQPICWPKYRQSFERNENCFFAGWGKRDLSRKGKEKTMTLQFLHEDVQLWRDCKRIWKHSLYENHICYGRGDPTPCNGDSGGGLMCKDGKYWRLAGIASWVLLGCDKGGYPAAFIEVSKYMDWIEKTMARTKERI